MITQLDRARWKLEKYNCEFLYLSNSIQLDPNMDWIYYKCRCGLDIHDQIHYLLRTTTPLCSQCQTLEVDTVLHKDKRVYSFGITKNKCKIYCDNCKCMFQTGKLKAYKKIILDRVMCVRCNKQRRVNNVN